MDKEPTAVLQWDTALLGKVLLYKILEQTVYVGMAAKK